jgi:hypothetical protein
MLQDFHVNAVVGVAARQNGYSGLAPHQMKTQALHSIPFKVTLEKMVDWILSAERQSTPSSELLLEWQRTRKRAKRALFGTETLHETNTHL